MRVCPIDFKPCCDDICHGGGCLRTQGSEEMIEVCQFCHIPIVDRECGCDPDGRNYYDEYYPENIPGKDGPGPS
jgi:hypothetical protein